MDIRQRIETLAARRGIQKKDLAERMGKRKENLNTLITNPKWDTIELVAQALGIEPWELFREEIEAAGLEIVKKGTDPAPSPAPTGGRGMAAAQGSGDEGIANADIQGSRITNPSEPGFGQQASDGERPDLITIDPVTGESRKYKLIR